QTRPGSGTQRSLQPSQLVRLPSSQPSPASSTPSPQCACWQSLRHAFGNVSSLPGPSSHCSSQSVEVTPSPQTHPGSRLQSASQPSQPSWFPSSHSSLKSTTPSPHAGNAHVVRQVSGAVSLLPGPASHFSHGVSTTPSPHPVWKGGTQ